MAKYARIRFRGGSKLYTFRVPEGATSLYSLGQSVRVPVGERVITGEITEFTPDLPNLDEGSIKDIFGTAD